MATNNRFNPLTSPAHHNPEAAVATWPNIQQPSGTAISATAPPTVGGSGEGGVGRRRRPHRAGKKKRARRKSFAAPILEANDSGDSRTRGDGRDRDTSAAEGRTLGHDAIFRLGRNLSSTSLESTSLFDDHRTHSSMRPRRQSTSLGISSNHGSGYGHSHLHPHRYPSEHGQSRSLVDDYIDEDAPLLPRHSSGEDARVGTAYGSRGSRGSPRPGSLRSSQHHLPQPCYDVNFPASHPASPILGASNLLSISFGDVMITNDIDVSREGSVRASQDDATERTTLLGAGDAPDAGAPSDAGDAPRDSGSRLPDSYGLSSRRRRRRWPDLAILNEWSRYETREGESRAKRITEPQLINGRLRPLRKGWYMTEEDAPYRFTYFNEEFPSTIHSQTISELLHEGGSFRELFRPEPRVLSDDESSDGESDENDSGEPAAAPDQRRSVAVNGGGSALASRQPSVYGTSVEMTSPHMSEQENEPIDSAALQGSSVPTVKRMNHSPTGSKSPLSSQGERTQTTRTCSPRPLPLPLQSQEPLRACTPDNAAVAGELRVPHQHQHQQHSLSPSPKPVRYGDRPVWWLDVLCPTEAEMKVISKAFGVHPLTAEDIMMQEAREKVELFRNYYFVNYRTFDQDASNASYLEPVNMYVVVFREGVLSFHFSMTPHAANVRRRIRQLKDYFILSSDWISYAIIDDITDVFGPLIQRIEDEVDEIDEVILRLHEGNDDDDDDNGDAATLLKEGPNQQQRHYHPGRNNGALGKDLTSPPSRGRAISIKSSSSAGTFEAAGGDMLRKVGNCRKRVMSLFRLLGSKADVIKGFAKRCNERWEVAPRSEIGLYLGDIQDHIVTMTGNLGHYEKILARSHANYLAQINIRMTARQEQTADVLGKLTVLGTIVLPMNIITGLWGMNVWVPGQEDEGNLTWFWSITAGLLMFGMACYWIAKRVYGIV